MKDDYAGFYKYPGILLTAGNSDEYMGNIIIGNEAFHDCDALEEVKLEGKFVYTGFGSFAACDKLCTVVRDDSIRYSYEDSVYPVCCLGAYSFYDTPQLSTFELYESSNEVNITSIGKACFAMPAPTANDSLETAYLSLSSQAGKNSSYAAYGADMDLFKEKAAVYGCADGTDNIAALRDTAALKTKCEYTSIFGDFIFANRSKLKYVSISRWDNGGVGRLPMNTFYACADLSRVSVGADVSFDANIFRDVKHASFYFSTDSYSENNAKTSHRDHSGKYCAKSRICSWSAYTAVSDFVACHGTNIDMGKTISGKDYLFTIKSKGSAKGNLLSVEYEGALNNATSLGNSVTAPFMLPTTLAGYSIDSAEADSLARIAKYIAYLEIPDGISYAPGTTFRGSSVLKYVKLGDGVSSLAKNAFNGCSALSTAVLSDRCGSIGSAAFVGCADGLRVTIPSTATTVTKAAFNSVSSGKSVTLCTPKASVAYLITNEKDAAPANTNIYWENYKKDDGGEGEKEPGNDEEEKTEYTVSFLNDDASFIGAVQTIRIGSNATPPAAGTFNSAYDANYIFDHWLWTNGKSGASVTGDAAWQNIREDRVIIAIYKAPEAAGEDDEKQYYHVSFYSSGDVLLSSEVVERGHIARTQPKEPEDFAGWYDMDTGEAWDRTVPVYRDIRIKARRIAAAEETSALAPAVEYASNIYLVKGQSMQLPAGYKWMSKDERIAKPDKNGKFSAKAAGSTVLYTTGGEQQSTLYVVEPKLSVKSLSLAIGESAEISISGLVNGSKDISEHYPVYFSSSAQNVAKVSDGIVYALAKGSGKINATVNGKTYSVKLSVVNTKAPGELYDGAEFELAPLQSVSLKILNFTPSGASWGSNNGLKAVYDEKNPTKLKWYQDDVVRITKAGKITAVGAGKSILSGRDKNGRSVKLTVSVRQPVENVLYMNKGASKSVSYYGVKSKDAKWSLKNVSTGSGNVVSMISIAKLRADNAGQAKLSCSYDPYGSGGFTFTTLVCVESPYLDRTAGNIWRKKANSPYAYEMVMSSGEVQHLTMQDCYQTISYTSSKPAVAWVDEYGCVHAQKVGDTTIKTKINGKSYSIKLMVR